MKRFILLGILLFSALLMTGCACYPGFGMGGCCTTPYTYGPVDYVDGSPGSGEANCGTCYNGGYSGMGSGMYSCSPCVDLLRCVGHSVRVLGEGALTIVAAPFVIVGHVICSTCTGYESYPNCGCSNEVYYGDNCLQQHDLCDPCCGGSGNYGSNPATSGCSKCNGGYSEGIQAEVIDNEIPTKPEANKTGAARVQQNSVTNQGVKPVSYYNPRYSLNQPQRIPTRR